MKTRLRILLTLCGCLVLGAAAAQSDRITEQKRVVAELERRIAEEERAIARLQKGRAANEERARRLARQIGSRSQLLDATEREAALLRDEIARKDSLAGDLEATLTRYREQYASMVREAYRNYRHRNYLTFLFSSRDFGEVARRLTALREAASVRERKMRDIASLRERVDDEKRGLDARRLSLDSATRRLTDQKLKLERDAATARANVRRMTSQERTALRRKVAQEQQLDAAVSELRKLTKGNTAGASFSQNTRGLRLPLASGRVKRYKGNMAEITGPRGAEVRAIYEGKIVEIKRNRITGKYDVFVAHGDYISSYANLGSVAVEKGQRVARDGRLGSVGPSVDILTMETEYKLVFGIYAPEPNRRLLAENCFKR